MRGVHRERRGGYDVLVAFARKVLGARLERCLERLVLVVFCRIEVDEALVVEHPRHRTTGAEVAVVAAEGVTHFGHGSIRVVGRGLDQDCGAAGPIALVRELLVLGALEFAGALLDGALDVLLRHVDRARAVHGQAQARVAVRVATAGAGRHGDFADDLGPHRRATRVRDRLLPLDLLPFAVASHRRHPLLDWACWNHGNIRRA
jgi:hypothetical protein